eukprot:gene11940-13176_t
MVHSKAYIINDLETRIKFHNESKKKIDKLEMMLSKRFSEINAEIEEKFEEQIEALIERKRLLMEELIKIESEEMKSLCMKRLEAYNIVPKLSKLLTLSKETMSPDIVFRSHYEKEIDQLGSCEDFDVSDFEMNFYANGGPLKVEIEQFGMISLERMKQSSASNKASKLVEGTDNWLIFEDADKDGDSLMSTEDKAGDEWLKLVSECAVQVKEADEDGCKNVCQLKACCNCVEVCEEIADGKEQEDLHKWLVSSNDKVTPVSQELPAALQQLAESKVLSQFESLKLFDDQVDSSCLKEMAEADYQCESEAWTDMQLDEAMGEKDGALARSSNCDVLDALRATPLNAWLKHEPVKEDASSDKPLLQSSASLQGWLKRNEMIDIEDIADVDERQCTLSVLKHFDVISKSPLHIWLKQDPMSHSHAKGKPDNLDVLEKIQNSQLDFWLKRKSVADEFKWLHVKPSQQYENASNTSENGLVLELNKIMASPLANWLKHGATKSSRVCNSYSQIYGCERNPHTMDLVNKKMAKEDLRCWLKRPPSSPVFEKNVELKKWLR